MLGNAISQLASMNVTERDQILLATLNAVVDGIIVICDKAIIRLFSQGAEKLFGYDANEVVGKNVNILMPEPHHAAHDGYIRRFLETRQKNIIGTGRHVNALDKAGHAFPIHLSVSDLQTDNGTMFVGIARDLRVESNLNVKLDAERKKTHRLQRKLNEVHGTSTLSELVSSIAHEINQPLAAITSYADTGKRLLDRNPIEARGLEQIVEKISSQALRAGSVVRQLREISTIGVSPREVVSIKNTVTEIRDMIETDSADINSNVAWVIESSLPNVLINSLQIQQVLVLILRNGLESLATREQRRKGVEVVARRAKGFVEIEIIDHGPGIEDDRLETLYHPFTTTKSGKMGLGLSICQTIVSGHGGRLWHQANPTGGSRFIFTLPIHQESEES